MTNSSISLATSPMLPRTIAPAPWSAVIAPLSVKAIGLRNASNRLRSFDVPSGIVRRTFSVSIECPNRYTTWANSATMAGSMVGL